MATIRWNLSSSQLRQKLPQGKIVFIIFDEPGRSFLA